MVHLQVVRCVAKARSVVLVCASSPNFATPHEFLLLPFLVPCLNHSNINSTTLDFLATYPTLRKSSAQYTHFTQALHTSLNNPRRVSATRQHHYLSLCQDRPFTAPPRCHYTQSPTSLGCPERNSPPSCARSLPALQSSTCEIATTSAATS